MKKDFKYSYEKYSTSKKAVIRNALRFSMSGHVFLSLKKKKCRLFFLLSAVCLSLTPNWCPDWELNWQTLGFQDHVQPTELQSGPFYFSQKKMFFSFTDFFQI